MSDRHRAEMAESKLRAIKRIILEMTATEPLREIGQIIDAEVWDGYQTVDIVFKGETRVHFDHKEP